MKKLIVISLILAALLCPWGGRELADVTLIQTLAVDGAGTVAVTAAGEGEDAQRYRAIGPDVVAARKALAAQGTDRLETTHIRHLVLGPEVDVVHCLWQELTHRESGYGATVWLCRTDPAASALNTPDVSDRLSALEENAGVAAPTILEALSALVNRGRATFPVLATLGGELLVTGYETVEVEAW